ncbi:MULTISPECIES: DUF5343 domain-containing protein [unclassified Rhodanobacter]|uniref:DUF5343 domain-containing protein n=1 Tax=Rhodanobacter humi TaxID=1888173 RepID=A0ABV4APZ7_9GAMM
MAAQKEVTIKPPYVSFTTFTNAINKLREVGVPNRIDASVFRGQSGSGIAALIGAMKYLGFIDDAGTPSGTFKQLVDSKDEERGAILKPVLLDRYKFITNAGFGLENATSQQVEQAFRDQNISGSTVTKSVGFFLAAADLAGLKTSSHVKPPKPPRSSGGSRPKKRAMSKGAAADTPSTPHAKGAKSTAELLLEKFPDFDPAWDVDLKKKWFDAFGTLQTKMLKED